ncbi:hypothetical protein C5167_028218 [Papaver somniferum]|nr:hypothetical protein C5167_028218 [Papaver somniferum]
MGGNILEDGNNMDTYTHLKLDLVHVAIPPLQFLGVDDVDLDVDMLLEGDEAAAVEAEEAAGVGGPEAIVQEEINIAGDELFGEDVDL